MPKHRGPILEHQTSTPASLSDFTMDNATNSQEFAYCLAIRMPQPPQAIVDLGLELGNKRFVSREMAYGEEANFSIYYQLLSFTITRLVVVILPDKPALANLVLPEPPRDALRGAPGRGDQGGGNRARWLFGSTLFHAWMTNIAVFQRLSLLWNLN